MIRILHIAETAKGGVGTYIDTLLGFEDPNTVKAALIPKPHIGMFSNANNIFAYPYRGRSFFSIITLIFRSIITVRAFRPDIIFLHSTLSLPALIILRALFRDTRFLYCSHGWAGARRQGNRLQHYAIRLIEGRASSLSHRIVNVSEYEYNYALAHRYPGNHLIISNAVRDCQSTLPASAPTSTGPCEISILFVGRHDTQKGLDILLAAFAQARRSRDDLTLYVAGESVVASTPTGTPLVARKQSSPHTPNIVMLGWVGPSEIDAYYQAADVVVVPSRWEAFGLVVAESFRNGTPVIVSDRDALPHMVTPETGIVVPLTVDALSQALINLEKSQLGRMRHACRSRYEDRFHTARLESELKKLYSDLICATR